MKSDKESFDAIIIGSGIGGLVTASQLAAKTKNHRGTYIKGISFPLK